jgi:hypothetical protein
LFSAETICIVSHLHHSKGKGKYRTLGADEARAGRIQARSLGASERVAPDNCKLVWLTGNHEDWLEQMFEEQPELAGLIDFPTTSD